MAGQFDKKTAQLVKVYIRQRPFSTKERELRAPSLVQRLTSREIVISNKHTVSEKKYSYDEVFGEKSTQKEIYQVVVSPLIDYIINGYNCTVFAYGQTGTGKTHTVIGSINDAAIPFEDNASLGLIPRAAKQLFADLGKLDGKIEYTVRASFIEIYNEELRDLLVDNVNADTPPLRVYEDTKGLCIRGLNEQTVCNTRDVFRLLQHGITLRQTASTNCNRQSSRSHTVFTLIVHTRETTIEGEELVKTGKLHLVDLAGSENIGRSGATDARAREAGTINKSLLTLGKVIKALTQKNQHIPYRDSKLTRILQDSLGGKTKTCMIGTISPAVGSWDETVSTLEYASMARNVVNCPQVNINRKHASVIKSLTDEIAQLRQEISACRTGDGFYITQECFVNMSREIEDKTARIVECVSQIQELQDNYVAEKEERLKIQTSFTQTKEYLQSVRKELYAEKLNARKTDFVLEHVTKKGDELKTTAQDLVEICETLFKHEDIFHKNYNGVFNKTIQNMAVFKDSHKVFTNYIKSVKNAIDTFLGQHNVAVEEANRLNNQTKDILHKSYEQICVFFEQLNEANSKLKIQNLLKSENDDYSENFLENYFSNVFDDINAEILRKEELVNSLINMYSQVSMEKSQSVDVKFDKIMKTVEKLLCNETEFVRKCKAASKLRLTQAETKQKRFNSEYTYCESLLKQLSDRLHRGWKESSDEIETEIKSIREFTNDIETYDITSQLVHFKSEFEEDSKEISNANLKQIESFKEIQSSLQDAQNYREEKIDEAMVKAQGVISDVKETISSNLSEYLEENSKVIEKMRRNLVELNESMPVSHELMRKQLGAIEKFAKEFSEDSSNFSAHTTNTVGSFMSQIQNVTRNGDTPVRQTYSIPRVIEEIPRREDLLSQFNELDNSLELPEEILENGLLENGSS